MNKTTLLAGVSAVALVLSASAAFAFNDANGNTSGSFFGSATTNANDEGNLNASNNTDSNNVTVDASNHDNGADQSHQNANESVNLTNTGQLGNGNDINSHNSATVNGNLSGNTVVEASYTNTSTTSNTTDNNGNTATFGGTGAVTASVLGAQISASHVHFEPRDGLVYQGNTVTDSFNGSNGILAVNQNTGINANNQQAITVSVGDVAVTR